MAYTNYKYVNFCESNGFVTNGPNQYTNIGQAYPHNVTVDGDNFDEGWDTDKTAATGSDQVRDRNNAIDPRLAGIAFIGNAAGTSTWRTNVPAGTYNIRLALGDNDNQRLIYCRVLDNNTERLAIVNADTGAAAQWIDATSVVRTAANWPANNAQVTVSIASGILKVEIGTASGSDISAISTVGFQLVAAAALSSPTPSGTLGTQTTATIGATTDQSTGNFYVVVDSSANLAGVTASQIKAGQHAGGTAALASGDVAVSTSSPSVGVTGLVAGTSYAYAAIQNNANGDSNIVTGTFTTASAAPASGAGLGRPSGYRLATLMMS